MALTKSQKLIFLNKCRKIYGSDFIDKAVAVKVCLQRINRDEFDKQVMIEPKVNRLEHKCKLKIEKIRFD